MMVSIRRVPYGKESTPIKDREYKMAGYSPVGTISEWKAFIRQKDWERKLPTRCEKHKCRGAFNELPMVDEFGCFMHVVDVDMLTHHGSAALRHCAPKSRGDFDCAAKERKEKGGCPI